MFDLGNTLDDKLKYHRLKYNLTQNQLAKIIDFSNGSSIKDIELRREISKKLSSYFNLDAKYFYDNYLKETDNAKDILKDSTEKHNLTVKQICSDINISEMAWSSQESCKYYIGRDKYKVLKKHKIL